MKTTFCLLSVLAIVAITGCGGGKQTTTTSTQSQRAGFPVASPMAPGAGAGKTAAVPADVHCGASTPVWANTKTHVYHVSSDPLYGKTKHGTYMCAQDAVAHGYHAAGSGASMKSAYHHHRRKGANAAPAASPAASP